MSIRIRVVSRNKQRCDHEPKCTHTVQFIDGVDDDILFSLCTKEARKMCRNIMNSTTPTTGKKRTGNRPQYSDWEKDMIRKLHAQGNTPKEIATVLGRSYAGLNKMIWRMNHDGELYKSRHGEPPATL